MPIDGGQRRLEEYDRRGYVVVEVLRPEGRSSTGTASHPQTYLGIDGRTYWAKGSAQQGLVAELICGRLASRLKAGPEAKILHISDEIPAMGSIPTDQSGLVVGTVDISDTVNARDLAAIAQNVSLPPSGVDGAARAKAIVFQTWIGVSDAQVLVRMTDGHVLSIDHGDAFANTSDRSDPVILVTDIPGVAPSLGKRGGDVMPTVAAIGAITDKDLVEAVAQVPSGAAWRSPAARRLEIAEYLAFRRDRLQEVIRAWLRS